MIDWKDGAVCFAGGLQWPAECMHSFDANGGIAAFGDFQLNEMREGDYIKASELDTGQKYNDAASVFELFGFKDALSYRENVDEFAYDALIIDGGDADSVSGRSAESGYRKRKITYPQLMAIGKLKRAMIERDEALINAVENTSILSDTLNGNYSESPNGSAPTMGSVKAAGCGSSKSKQAYAILKSLDYEYDLVKQRWYKKAYI